jgi:hypothetical protein
MANIEINEALWNTLTDDDKNQVTESLKKSRLLKDGEIVTGNPAIPAPDTTNENWASDVWDRNKRGLCQFSCDAAAIAAGASLTLTGPGLAVALLAIETARQACHNSC